jgi:hypothetical protein
MGHLTELVKLPNGNLRIQLTDAGKAERAEMAGKPYIGRPYNRHLSYWLEWQTGNGWDWIRPEEIGALWGDDNILSDTAVYSDYGELVSVGTVYYDNFYAVRDPVTELLDEGYVDFWPAETEAA